MGQTVDIGHLHKVGIGIPTAPWGGAPVALGAGDAIECNSATMEPGAELVMNEGKYGSAYRRAGSPGNQKPTVQLDFDAYYRDRAAWRVLAQHLGKFTKTNPSTGVYKHAIELAEAADLAGKSLTVVDPGAVDVREVGHAKTSELTFSFAESAQRAKAVSKQVAFDLNHNQGGPSPAAIVAPVLPANGALTVVPMTHKAALRITVVDANASITELVCTMVGLDVNGEPLTVVYTLTVNGLLYTTAVFSSLTSATVSGITGTPGAGDTIQIEACLVATAALADGAKTVVAQPVHPSPFKGTLVDADGSTTAVSIEVVYEDRWGRRKAETWTIANATAGSGEKTWTTAEYGRKLLSVTVSGTTGAGAADTFRINVTNGVNNATTVAALTTSAYRDPILFTDAVLYVNEQDGADFVAAETVHLSGFEFGVNRSLDSRVTSRYGNRIEEPTLGGGGWPAVPVKLSLSAKTTRNQKFLDYVRSKKELKAKLVLTGPVIPTTSTAQSLTIYLNGLQLDGKDDWSDAGVIPVELTGEAHNVVAAPTGFPGGYNKAVTLELVNGQPEDLF